MTEEERYLQARLKELADRSYRSSCWQFSDFLSLAEQNLMPALYYGSLEGGYEAAERRLAAFGSEDVCGYMQAPPIEIVHIAPVQKKFADQLSHRDYLGALMSLGLKRSCLGDILLQENDAYLFCLDSMTDYILRELTSVRHTTVTCERCDSLPSGIEKDPLVLRITAASLRVDVLISAVFHLSRTAAKEYFDKDLVFCNGRQVASPGYQPDEGSIISVRGKGRFRFDCAEGKTKKGRISVTVSVW